MVRRGHRTSRVAGLTLAAPSQEPLTGGCAEKGLSASHPDTTPHLPRAPMLPTAGTAGKMSKKLK